jgi:hypothetical protein
LVRVIVGAGVDLPRKQQFSIEFYFLHFIDKIQTSVRTSYTIS